MSKQFICSEQSQFSNMKIFPSYLCFSPQKINETITLTNTTPNKCLFKVKVTNTQLFTIYPGRGTIEEKETVNINISLKGPCEFNAKMMVQWAAVGGHDEPSWSQIGKQYIRDQCIQITSEKEEKEVQDKTKPLEFKKTEPPLYQPEVEVSKSQNQSVKNMSESNSMINIGESQGPRPSIGSFYQQMRQPVDYKRQIVTSQQIDQTKRIQSLEQDLKKEKKSVEELTKRLKKREGKLRHYQNEQQKKINCSVVDREEGFQLGHFNVVLGVVICLMLGFLIARIDTGSPL